jgi:hypothetical protein
MTSLEMALGRHSGTGTLVPTAKAMGLLRSHSGIHRPDFPFRISPGHDPSQALIAQNEVRGDNCAILLTECHFPL